MEKTIVEEMEYAFSFEMMKFMAELERNDHLAMHSSSCDIYVQLPEDDTLPQGADRCNVPLDRTDIQELRNIMVAEQLQSSLELDKSNRYSVSKYYCMENKDAEKFSQTYDADRQSYYHSAKEFREYIGAEQEQAEIERRPSGNCNYVDHEKTVYSLPDLYVIKLGAEGKLLLLKQLLARKKPCNVTLAGYQALDDAIQEIKEKGKNIADARTYVSACMAIQKIEQANKFILCARMAEQMIARDIPEDNPFSERFLSVHGRFAYGAKTSTRYSTVYTEDDLRLAFDRTEGEPEWLAEKAVLFRFIQNELRFGMFWTLIKRGVNPRNWQERDFQAARDFFREKYPVVESYQPICTGSDEMLEKKMLYTRLRLHEIMELRTPEGAPFKDICYSPIAHIHNKRKSAAKK